MVVSPVGLGTKHLCAGEDQQQFTSQVRGKERAELLPSRGGGVSSSSQTPLFVEDKTRKKVCKEQKCGFPMGPETTTTVLARASSNLLH
jgi:hypothetical protein